MKHLRVLALVREGLVPPESLEGISEKEIANWKAEFDVIGTLRDMGHTVQPLGVYDDLTPIKDSMREFKPHIVFMLLEEFHGVVTYDHAVTSYLELNRQHYTGCNPRGLILSRDKALSKKILAYHRIRSPRFALFPRGRSIKRPVKLVFPLLVKSATEDASLGISQASIVYNDETLIERVKFMHERLKTDALVEQYIEGREIYVGVTGNTRLQTFRPWEMHFTNMPEDVARIATARVKWDENYQKKHGIETKAAEVTKKEEAEISKICKRVYRALSMSGYARLDLRMTASGKLYVIEANANPNISYGEDFAESAEISGINYEALLSRIVNLGLRYEAAWKA
jgi:D-alanine-D-alanine ligase